MATTKPAQPNRLANATSPYLQQHAHNPVDWYEWGPAALEKAKREDKPIFLSIGYSACHWCHVMAHESFENEEIAAVMNEHFVNIKVDREERPDIDEIYMQATLLMNQGQGGWPMSVWLTPERKPFFAGTYFPPESRYGRPGFKELCLRVAETWRDKRDALEESADRLTQAVAATLVSDSAASPPFTLEDIDRTAGALAGAFDKQRGGLLSGGSNKFPPSMALGLFLRAAKRWGMNTREAKPLLELTQVTLDRMAHGGIYDHLAGGIARYSTDPEWHVPHFEKMLYDQALVSRIYVDGWQVFEKPLYRRIACEIFDYVLTDLRAPDGGFYSARDADSEGEEGRYYVWTKAEIDALLGPEDGALFASYYDVSEKGNWQDPHAPGVPKNVLHVARDLEAVARLHDMSPDALRERLEAARAKLLDARRQRVAPSRDEKILAEWNGLMIASLARGGAVFGERKYVEAAARAAEFILERHSRDGRLVRASRDGQVSDQVFLTDYACMIEALLELYEATFERRWLDHAVKLNQAVVEHFYDESRGGFFFTPDDHETLIARSRDARDGATPAGNSVQLMNLLRLHVITGDESLRRRADATMNAFAAEIKQMPGAGERFLSAVEFALVGPVEIAVAGPADAPETLALLGVIRQHYLPNRVLMLINPQAPDQAFASPLLEGRSLVNGAPAAYVCRNYACQLPATEPRALAEQLSD